MASTTPAAVLLVLALLTLASTAQAQPETRLRITDRTGNTRYDLPALKVDRHGVARLVDRTGNTRHDLPSIRLDHKGRARPVDRTGNMRHDLPLASR